MAAAQREYEVAMYHAREAGFTNVKIARTIGMTEAGVRMWFKRRERRHELAS